MLVYFQRLLPLAEPAAVTPPRLDVCLAIVLLRAAIAVGALELFGTHYRDVHMFRRPTIRGGSIIPGRYVSWWNRDGIEHVLATRPLHGKHSLDLRARAMLLAALRAFGPAARRLP